MGHSVGLTEEERGQLGLGRTQKLGRTPVSGWRSVLLWEADAYYTRDWG